MQKKSLSRVFSARLLVFSVIPVLALGFISLFLAWQRFKNESEDTKEQLIHNRQDGIRNQAETLVGMLHYRHDRADSSLRVMLKGRVEEAHALAFGLYETYKDKMSESELRVLVQEALRPIRFNEGRCYYYCYSLDGIARLNAAYPHLEQKDQKGLKDARGKLIIGEMINIVNREGEGYINYYWFKPGEKGAAWPKVGYVKKFEPFNWFIGAGDYLDNVRLDVQEEIFRRVAGMVLSGDQRLAILARNGARLYSSDDLRSLGTGFWDTPKGLATAPMLWKMAETGEQEFRKGSWENLKTGQEDQVLFHARVFEPWDWLVVVASATDPLEKLIETREKQLGDRILRDLGVVSIGLLLLVILAVGTAKYTSRNIIIGLNRFSEFFEGAARDSRWLEPTHMTFLELEDLATKANLMIQERNQAEQSLQASRLLLEKANEELARRAYQDGLTGLANRRAFDQRIEEEWGRARRQGQRISVAMIDLDFFKNYNDTYGHLAGDQTLRMVAAAIEGAVRVTPDFAARYGGEEFVVILPGTDEKGAEQLAERIRKAIEDLKIPHESSKVASFVTISLGTATANPLIGSDIHQLIETADKMLYKAKASGRNRICCTRIA